ncbi:Galactose-6-phosphate isomerase subunit LacB [bioreactor metagenome]|uniref:Galactose-6-phosphate isomerase subunit LacB n=1 Tax=bioreactor metagenome TaxID=1076179 RepID=A0A645GMQ3_9ZZZZ
MARAIRSGAADRGILFCGTGMGVAIVANKFKGVRAAVVESELAAAKCRIINDANVLALGGMFVSEFVALLAVDRFLELAHTEGTDPELAAFLRRADAEIKKLEAENFR